MTSKEKFRPPDNPDDFDLKGAAYRAAWNILAEGCEVPPSLDVFEHEVEELRKRNTGWPVSVQDVAKDIAKRYRRISI